ncbi:hypothetical protein B0T18DRAFT_432499 [Schizothecium vesticola]|uniref:Uncharacterized protein n=1 Tax=Schizothecium vesticola TaxID=314040 RepID=A0AA40EL95_9PEZI|nr:hypothetical protein B0T18DRAFT_432499 [Schizothecium vesticola]
MKTSFATLLSSVFLLVGSAAAAAPPQYPKAPGLTYLYQVNITGGEAAVVGKGPRGVRIVVPILFGSFEGPRLKGKVLPIGGEWALLDGNNANGSLTNDVRQTFQTDDGAVIQIWETGQTQPDGSAYLRLAFETGSEKYYWINSVVAIGHLRRVTDSSLTIDAWQMTGPK